MAIVSNLYQFVLFWLFFVPSPVNDFIAVQKSFSYAHRPKLDLKIVLNQIGVLFIQAFDLTLTNACL
jgi:hypothetical protein